MILSGKYLAIEGMSVKLLQYYCLELPFEYRPICDLQKGNTYLTPLDVHPELLFFTILKGAQCIICP